MVEHTVTLVDNVACGRWDAFVAESRWGHLMQSGAWGDFKRALGWRVQRIGVEQNSQIVAGAQILFKPLPWLPLTIAYIPKGPLVDLADERTTPMLLSAIHQAARRQGAVFLKIEPNVIDDHKAHTLLQQYGFRSSVLTNQPRSTIVIELSESERTLLANMRKKTRKLIRRAEREGVEVIEGSALDLDVFYRIIATTADTKNIPVHDRVYYHKVWQAFRPTDSVQLLLARHEGEVVAVKMVFVFGDRSMHLWGGTSRRGREMNASYLIQWEAIKWARAYGCKYCDLWGIPDEIADILNAGNEIPKDQVSGLWGVYLFKRGFGGEIECYVGAYDYVYRPLLYALITGILRRSGSVDIGATWLERIAG